MNDPNEIARIGLYVSLASLGVSAVAMTLAAIAAFWTYWGPRSAHIRGVLDRAAPDLRITTGWSSGSHEALTMRVENEGPGKAYRVQVFPPGSTVPIETIPELAARREWAGHAILAPDAPIRTQSMAGAKVRILYRDMFDREFSSEYDLIHDGSSPSFSLAPTQGLHTPTRVRRPPVRFRDEWRLRNSV